MSSEFDFVNKLNFDDADLVAPEKVFVDILSRLEKETKGIVKGYVKEYSGCIKPRYGFFLPSTSGINAEAGKLGVFGEKRNLFEFYFTTECYQKYKFRVCFFEYGLAHYPVRMIVEDGIADDINLMEGANNEVICDTRNSLKEMIFKILNTKRVLTIMQELIRINQIYKDNPWHENEPPF